MIRFKSPEEVGFGMANVRNGERFLTGMANAYGRDGENAIIACYDLKYKRSTMYMFYSSFN